ncbi:centrosomal protein of 126 kDa isoform X1 [Epinephelus lanceolatus]|uniref:centrosomal protein of 126 kDa isoform X1 n=1 Tax=Epinephelus lanceolatus TaxID=310571 RepID=UPI001445AE01|nr:centrosomal protein of 126 kDa isoform X1 [Epinephelus lanceolatus]
MQAGQGDFFYHSNSRLGANGGLEDEKQLLVEKQKICRSRARKFTLETNRRRKALEEKRKQWDVQEQRLIESILKQRRQQVQDATERFQRAHLPPSQRHRQFYRRNVPNIEDALNQIQGSLSSYIRQSSFLSSSSRVSRSCTPSPKPPTVAKSSHRPALSVVEAYTKLLQEQSMSSFKNSQQAEKTQEKQQDHSPQDSQLSDCCNSESLSSKDSLDNEDLNHNTKHLQYSYSSFLLDSEKPNPDLRKQNDLCPTSDLTSSSAVMLFGDNLAQSNKLHESKQKKQEHSGEPNNKMHISKASWGFTSVEQTPKTDHQAALQNCNLLTLCEILSADPEHFELKSSQNIPNDNIIITDRVAPSNAALEPSCPKQDALLDVRQKGDHDDRQLKPPSAPEIILPAKNGDSSDILFEAPSKPNIFLNDSTTDNASEEGALQQTEKEIHYLSPQKERSASINNLNKLSKPEHKTEKPCNAALLQHTCLSNIQSDAPKCLKCPEEEVQKLPVSVGTSHPVCEVRFIKGILKKPSKYMPEDATCVYGSGHLIFAKQGAFAIRDSVELTRTKTKAVEGNSSVKKKLRWFDEVQDKDQNIMKQIKGKSYDHSQSEDHQLSLTTVSGASKPGPSMTPPASTGYHFTKQAWADVGVQVSLPQERADEVKVPRSSTRTNGPKGPRRESSARAGAGPVSSRIRKGTIIRPQSATEVSQIAKTQGRTMVPHPPPRMELMEEKTPYITKTPYGLDHASLNCKQALAVEQVLHKVNSGGIFSPYTHNVIRTDSAVMYTPLPPSCTYPFLKGNMKRTPSSGHQETQGCSRRRGMVYNEKGLCLDSTPTDEEISQLWHGVRSALATKDAKNMFRRQALDSGRAVRKACVEQSRQPPGSGNRRLPQPSQSTKQTTEPARLFSSTYNMAFPHEGLVSAAQLHLAEVHAGGLLEETDVVAAMETAQTQRPGTVQQHSQQQGLTTISLEEQKILLSLDRLNHQLYCVREHVGGNSGMRGLVLYDAPTTGEVKVTNHHKHRAASANNRSRYQNKF